jgi:hypothetical protein
MLFLFVCLSVALSGELLVLFVARPIRLAFGA